MTQTVNSPQFNRNARKALDDAFLQKALARSEKGFIERRKAAVEKLPEYDALRDNARDLKDHILSHLDLYLEAYEKNVVASGGHVHWAATAEEANEIILGICKRLNAKTVAKGKSMISEETGLNAYLEENGVRPIETDLGEYIIQLRGETPSHIIAPALHVTKEQIEADFRRAHTELPPGRNLDEPTSLLAEARAILRESFLNADVGITGANFLIAETGSSVIVTNEGNGDLTQTLPSACISCSSQHREGGADARGRGDILAPARALRVGQDLSVYTTFSTGARREGDPDGPFEYHVVLLDNGRSNMLGGKFQEMLRCIRCGACMNHCPVFHAVGGHAYGWVYPGPMGAVLTPSAGRRREGRQLPNASTFCGRCEEVCPVRIPLPKLMRNWREREFERHLQPATVRYGLGLWAAFAKRPALYRAATSLVIKFLRLIGGKGRFRALPLAGGWTRHRDFPTPQGETFQSLWSKRSQSR
jgi:L-lactate dehydrogenase complex protein LldF